MRKLEEEIRFAGAGRTPLDRSQAPAPRATKPARRLARLGATSLVALATAAAPAAAANKVIQIGDSWGYAFGDGVLARQFDRNGHGDYDVLNIAVPGATADAYAQNLGGILDLTLTTIAATPTVEYVTVSLGGNDLHALYASLGLGANVEIEADLRILIDRINETKPGLQIVLFGYDILKWDKSPECLVLAFNFFQGHVLPWEVNPIYLDLAAHLQAISASYANVTYVNEPLGLWGTGQGNPGVPNIFAWSPSSYVASDNLDCVHLSPAGYDQFAAQVYSKYFAPRLGPGTGCTIASGAAASGHTGADAAALPVAGAIVALAARRRRDDPVAPADAA